MTDRMIRARCELPAATAVFGKREQGGGVMECREPIYASRGGATNMDYLEDEAARIAHVFGGMGNSHVKDKIYLPSHEHPKPMIHPFVAYQVREIERNGTERELQYLKALGYDEARKIIGGHITNMRVDPILGLQIRQKIISYGLSSMGYDVRLARDFKIFTNALNATIDPLDMSDENYVDFSGDVCVIPPNSYILGHTEETFDLEPDEIAICLGKSTYARAAAIVNVTPIEPGFKGQVVIEISNASPNPLKVYAGQGIAQFMFFKASQRCETSYADRKGKYQNQTGVTTARV
jgi:dCTP deaminase